MPTYETLDVDADSGGSQEITPRVTKQTFKDRYEQITTNGTQTKDRSMTLSFTGDSDEVDALSHSLIVTTA